MNTQKLILTILTILSLTTSVFAVAPPDNAKAVKVSGGEGHTLVIIHDSNSAYACGDNGVAPGEGEEYYGTLGIGSTGRGEEYTLVRVHDGNMGTASGYLEDINDVSAGWQHSLAADTSGFVWAWGWNAKGQLGNNSTTESTVPIQVLAGQQNPSDPYGTYLQDIDSVAAGRSGKHSLALDTNDYVWAWGLNTSGQLGDNSKDNRDTPVQVKSGEQDPSQADSNLVDIVGISAGKNHSMAVDANSFVFTWGSTTYGKLGDGSTSGDPDKTTPVQVKSGEQDPCNSDSNLVNIIAVSAGWLHSMALEKLDSGDANCNGRVYTWGGGGPGTIEDTDNSPCGGRLGNGDVNDACEPVIVLSGDQDPENNDSNLINIVAIAAGEGHSMALDKDGFVWTWGDNYYGQLGIGTTAPNSLVPKKVVGYLGEGYLENIVAISAGYWHCLAIDNEGRIWSWGKAGAGSLGLGLTVDRRVARAYPLPVVLNDTNDSYYFSIQDALNVASSGDVIKAWPGAYGEHVDIDSSVADSITLQSYAPNDLDTIKATIIASTIRPGSPFYEAESVRFYENTGSTVKGFTITSPDANTHSNGVTFDELSSGTITNCIIRNCNNDGVRTENTYTGQMTIKNCWIYDNGADGSGSGIYINYSETPTIVRSCTIVDNNDCGIKRKNDSVTISNCILWGNADDLNDCSATYSCIENGDGGEGNIFSDPCFVDEPNNNFHIRFYSDCKNAGDTGPDYSGEFDIDGETREMETAVDIGADETYYRVHNLDKDKWYRYIQQALDDANTNCVIEVNEGTYYEAVDFGGASCTLTSLDPYDWDVVNATIIDANSYDVNAVTFDSNEDSNTTLAGFRLTGAKFGVYCGSGNPVITRCIAEDCNVGIGADETGSPLIINNIARNNDDGIGHVCGATSIKVKNNLVYDNDNGLTGFHHYGMWTVRNNTIVHNSDNGIIFNGGGGSVKISNCILWDNGNDLEGCSATYSCIEDGNSGTGNFSVDPCFVNPDSNNFHLTDDSACINAGDPNGDYSGEFDIDDEYRSREGDVDVGADEAGPTCWGCATQCHGDADCDGFVDTADWPPYRDGYGHSYPEQEYLDNVCGDFTRDGTIDNTDWAEYRDNYGTSPPANCSTSYEWPPAEGKGKSGDGSKLTEEMIEWMAKNDLPGWEKLAEEYYE